MLGNHASCMVPKHLAKDVPVTTVISIKIDDDVRGLTPQEAARMFEVRTLFWCPMLKPVQ
jgi:hypothetical protein